jgi:NAD(P)-dependent dehydrogenase (short-subunit alcohol dehydrogenase family)
MSELKLRMLVIEPRWMRFLQETRRLITSSLLRREEGVLGDFQSLDEDILRGVFDSKFWAHWNTAQAALPALTVDGTLVFVTAASSRLANPGTSGLAAVNGAIEKMVPTLARELAPRRVNAVSPGATDTEWWKDKPKDMLNTAAGKAPLKRPGRAEEVADAIAFLLGNAFVTGVILDVDGGLHLN